MNLDRIELVLVLAVLAGTTCFSGGEYRDGELEDYYGENEAEETSEQGDESSGDSAGDSCPDSLKRCGDRCVDIRTDHRFCGGCDADPCIPVGANTEAECIEGDCERTCKPGWSDEDGDWRNRESPPPDTTGCETNMG